MPMMPCRLSLWRAGCWLAMRAVVAEEGIVLKWAGTLAWHRFLQRTWQEQSSLLDEARMALLA